MNNVSADRPLKAPGVEVHQITSRFVDQTFEIHVQMPMHLEGEKFPVLYLTDSYDGVAFRDTTGIMQLGADVPRFISVGIGYHDEHRMNAMNIRTRDLTPVQADSGGPDIGSLVEGAKDLNLEKTSGGAAEFLQFIREELMPFIDERYPTMPEDRGYWGDSLGGLFGLHVMFNQPETFNRYIIGSPSVWWADGAILEDIDRFIESGKPLQAHVFLAVGEQEAGGGYGMVQNVFVFQEKLMTAGIEGLKLKTHIFPGETHTSVIAMNYVKGIQYVYGRPDINELAALLAPPAD